MHLEQLTQDLNPQQKQAVLSEEQALLILAGAGSGKTKVLTQRICHLMAQGVIGPLDFLALTFTNKAAGEMKHRISEQLFQLGFPTLPNMWISTFHSMGARILREHIELVDYPSTFTICDSDDQIKVIKNILKKLDLNQSKDHNPKALKEAITKAKSLAIHPHETEKLEIFWTLRFQEIYTEYEAALFESKSLDFADLLFKTYDLLLSYPEVLDSYKRQFKHIFIDEYQDTNELQYKLVKLLAENSAHTFAVGDEDQSIYSWRGANVKNITRFEQDFQAYKIKLEQNYRSTSNIIQASNSVIARNTFRNKKVLRTDSSAGAPITIISTSSDYGEAQEVAHKISDLIHTGVSPHDVAIFYRMNSQSRVLEEQLRLKTIPYRIIGGLKFYDRKEIKDVLAFMKLIINPNDNISLLRIINVPARGIGKKTLETLQEHANQKGIPLWETLQNLKSQAFLKPNPRTKLLKFLKMLEDLQSKSDLNLLSIYHEILDSTGYLLNLQAENTSESTARIQNLEEFSNALSHFEEERGEEGSLVKFLEEAALISDVKETAGEESLSQVSLMTLHASKGLEFPHVFIVGLEENVLPCRTDEDTQANLMELEEERRLMYVGMTRAKEKLTLSYAHMRKVWGQTQFNDASRFLSEIPVQHTIQIDASTHSQAPNHSSGSWRSFSNSSSKTSTTQDYSHDPFPNYEADEGFSDQEGGFSKGQSIKHPIFGLGSILDIEGSGEGVKVQVIFKDKSVRKFVAKYARLERV